MSSAKVNMHSEQIISKVLSKIGSNFKVESAACVKNEDIIDFLQEAYSDQFNSDNYRDRAVILRRWEWANLNNPNIYDKQLTSWVCKESKNNKIVGHFGIMPVSLKVKNLSYRAAWGRDLIVLPKYRGLSGIGPLLVDSVAKIIKDKFSLFLLVGLNESSYTLFKRLGFIDLGYVPLYVRLNRADNILRSKLPNKILSRFLGLFGESFLKLLNTPSIREYKSQDNNTIQITEIENFNDSFDELWQIISCNFPIIIKRDRINLNWRFVHQPFGKYNIFKAETKKDRKLSGYIVLREGKARGLRIGVISDLFVRPDDILTTASLIGFSIKFFEKNNTDLLRCDILHKGMANIFKKFGFIGIHSNSHFLAGNLQHDLIPNFISDKNNWFITYADSDLDLSAHRL